MSGEQISIDKDIKDKKLNQNTKKSNVDINVLLNRVRADQKKEKFENAVFISMVEILKFPKVFVISEL